MKKTKLLKNLFIFLCFTLLLNPNFLSAQKEYPDSIEDGVYYEVNGKKLWTVSHGQGDPLFFIAGGPGGSHPGLRSFDPLSEFFTLVYFDGYGRGKSDTAQNVTDYSIDGDIDDLEGLRKAMGFDKISVLQGSSPTENVRYEWTGPDPGDCQSPVSTLLKRILKRLPDKHEGRVMGASRKYGLPIQFCRE